MKTMHLATGLDLPPDAITRKFAFLGQSGSGKTYAAMKLAELLLDAGGQIVALDPVGVWWGLRLAASGKSVGREDVYIFGGDHGDLPLTPESGHLIADLVVDRMISIVLDVSQFTLSETKRFAAAFAEQLSMRKKTARSPLHLFLEEAQTFVPQNPERDEATMLNRFERLGKLGRNWGIGNSLVSQQPQAVNKKVLNEIDCLVALRTIGKHQRKAIAEWVSDAATSEEDLNLVGTLPGLETGDAHIWSPSWLKVSRRVHIAKKWTFDASATPEPGQEKAAEPKPLSDEEREKIGAVMAEVVAARAKEDPKLLQKAVADRDRKIAGLEAELVKAGRFVAQVDERTKKLETAVDAKALALAKSSAKAISEANAKVKWNLELVKSELLRAEKLQAKYGETMKNFDSAILGVREEIEKVEHQMRAMATGAVKVPAGFRPSVDAMGALARPGRIVHVAARDLRVENGAVSVKAPPGGIDRGQMIAVRDEDEGAMSASERALLGVVAQLPNGAARTQLSVMLAHKRSYRDLLIQKVSRRGYLETRAGGRLYATRAGLDALGSDWQPLPTGQALIDHWRARLPPAELAIFDAVVAAYPNPVDKDSLLEGTGQKRSYRDLNIQKLARRELLGDAPRGTVVASPMLFTEAP